MRARAWRVAKAIGVILVLAVLVAAAVGVIVEAPSVLVQTTGTYSAAERAKADSDARALVLQFLGGIFLIGGLYFTARTYLTSRDRNVTDAYENAVDQLGGRKVEVRVGGIYALERIARSSRHDRGTIVEVLAAFVRMHAIAEAERPEADIEAAVVVLGRLPRPLGIVGRINLRKAKLKGAQLARADLRSADLRDAGLQDTDLTHANLRGALLDSAHLEGADVREADFHKASISSAHLEGAKFAGAKVQDAHLDGAHLDGTRFVGPSADDPKKMAHADLTGTRLHGAIMSQSVFTSAQLKAAHGVTAVQWADAIVDPSSSTELEDA